MINIGNRIKELRTNKKLSMRELAEKLEVSHAHISKIESGENLPSLTLLEKMAEVFDVKMRDFFDVEDLGELEPGVRIAIDKNVKDGLSEEDKQKAIDFVRDLKAGKIDFEKLKDIDV